MANRLLLTITLLLFPFIATAAGSGKIYRTTDAQGNVVFTDAPPVGSQKSEEVEIRHINTTPAPSTSAAGEKTANAGADNDSEPAAVGYQVAIVAPQNETTVPNGPGNFTVAAKVEPKLREGHNLQLFLDGAPRGGLQRSDNWQLTNVFRGEHALTVGVIDENGEALARSEPITVFVFRPKVR